MPRGQVLLRGGRPMPLTRKTLRTLIVLVERRGRLVTKEELMKEVWPDTFVEEANGTAMDRDVPQARLPIRRPG